MFKNTDRRKKTGRTFGMLAGFVAVCAIALLTYNVSREIQLLSSASSDNVQWSLAQTHVEFLEFKHEAIIDPVDVKKLRQEFDIFYSRIRTLQRASVFESLRRDPTTKAHLDQVLIFLDQSVSLIDASDSTLIARRAELAQSALEIEPTVRLLGNSGLKVFAYTADSQRQAVASTMTQLAIALAGLIGVLAFIVIFLNRLNARIYRRERENHQTATRMNTVINTSLDGVIISDANGCILEFSPAAEAIFGHNEEDVLGKDIGGVIVPDHMRHAHEAGMERMRMKGEKRVVGHGRVQLEAKRGDGSIFPVELAIQSANTDQGEIFIAFLRDISQRVAAEAELIEARDKALASEKLKTDFLSTMSHEIRTPLNGLLGNMNLLRDTDLTPNQDRYVGHMETSGRLLMSHISDVLDITRYDAGKLSVRSEPMNISALIQDIVDNQSGMAAKNETALNMKWLGDPVDWVLSDHDKMQHVMMNLIGNAVKFTKQGSVAVTIENIAQASGTELSIRISDTGYGMDKELTARVFDDFVTGNTAYDRDVGGTGLGLSIAKRFVNALGGEIGVESELGKGSTFWVRLPTQATEQPAQQLKGIISSQAATPLKVLLVEDNEINRIVAREMLQADGHVVAEAHDGQQGVETANATKFDLILMDISMPVMDGRVASRLIREEDGASAATPIYALTANAMPEERDKFIEDGMNGTITKPLSRTALRDLLQAIVPNPYSETTNYIDLAHSAEAREILGEEAFFKLLHSFVDEADAFHAWISAKEQPLNEVIVNSHKTAGGASVLGATVLRDSLKRIEQTAKLGKRGMLQPAIGHFGRIWKDTKNELLK